MSENFGSKLPSTGFAITVDSILGTQERNETKARVDLTPNCVVYYEEGAIRDAYKIYNNVNDMGKKCVISLYEEFDEALAHAKSMGAETFYHVRKEKTEIINL